MVPRADAQNCVLATYNGTACAPGSIVFGVGTPPVFTLSTNIIQQTSQKYSVRNTDTIAGTTRVATGFPRTIQAQKYARNSAHWQRCAYNGSDPHIRNDSLAKAYNGSVVRVSA